ncbi:MAG: hypothetical protein A2X55_07695 [Nitrospirae bacterium GWB2_47_37]|nr:MAG: hypothetical protein A2Z82_06345 [Nitrospirae bacterium GWA2_46_11]OGW23285.1 MAG: hypothetical protein A2X55_07695 [Nitrospirae bacterium GWB2_47_37]
MNFRHKSSLFLFLTSCFLIFISSVSFAVTPEPPKVPSDYVNDLAGIIETGVETRLNAYLKELEQKTTAQVFVLTVQSLDGEDIEGFSLRTAEKWKPGQKGKDNGVLITVALNDRKYRIETGYGIEGILPDSLVGSIGRQHLVPYFRKGDYSTGIFNASVVVAQKIAEHEGVEITGMPKIEVRGDRQGIRGKKEIGFFDAIILFAVFGVIIFLFIKHPRLLLLLLLSSSMGGRRSGWSGGGGFGGGFGGGGGGGFGGGGASGSW